MKKEEFTSSLIPSIVRSGAYFVLHSPDNKHHTSIFLDWEGGGWYGYCAQDGPPYVRVAGRITDLLTFVEGLNL